MAEDKSKIPSAGKGKAVEHAKDPKAAVRFLWKYLKEYKMLLLFALLLTLAANTFALIGPELSGKAIDSLKGKGLVDFETAFKYAKLMILFYVGSAILSYILALLMRSITQKIVKHMRKDVFDKLMKLPVSYFDTHMAGDIISRVSYDIDVINTSLSTDVVQILASTVTIIGSFIMMVKISPILVLVMCVTIPCSFMYTKKMTKITRPKFSYRSKKLGEMNGFVEETVGGQKVIQGFARENVYVDRFSKVNIEATEAYYQADYMNATIGPSVNMINNLSLCLVTIFGALLYFLGNMTLGNVSSFVLYSRKFSGPINEAANIIGELQSALAAAERVNRILSEDNEPADIENALKLYDVKGNVSVKDVQFGYTPEKLILKDFSLEAPAGKLIAVVGPTGAGKTTLINLLMRFYDPVSGEIRVDGYENKEVTRASLRSSYAMVLQDTWVFGGTIFENIAYGKENATMEEVVEAAKAARIHSFIMHQPQGYDTVLTEDGVNISKGQKQLLTIARAMLLDANMLILDEATSNVDTRTEKKIQSAMEKLMEGKTCFIIAHRLSTIEHADEIIVVADGRIQEKGRHEELMAKRGAYYELYAAQIK
ncbi:MAG: ABC transporter ATP-binding protein/permease [Lachnospiraceae bacterium]|nr:ABC transporter ATP-binding protein/permease [Lachnospiraceae bacterium]